MKQQVFKYLRVYGQISELAIKTLLEYRLNAVVQASFGFVYFAGLFIILQTVFAKTNSLGGWNKAELMVMLGLTSVNWGFIETFYFGNLRRFMMVGVANGTLDSVLTKPVSPQFLISFSQPNMGFVAHPLGLMLFLIYWLWQVEDSITLSSLLSFLVVMIASSIIVYTVFLSYAALAFYLTKSSQTIRALQTLADHAQYPTAIYPFPIFIGLSIVVPIAFIGYFPTVFLFGRGNSLLLSLIVSFAVITYLFSKIIWRISLRRYTSVSS